MASSVQNECGRPYTSGDDIEIVATVNTICCKNMKTELLWLHLHDM